MVVGFTISYLEKDVVYSKYSLVSSHTKMMNQHQYTQSTRGCQTRRRAEIKYAANPTHPRDNILESSYKTQLDLAVKGVLFESLYPLSREEIANRMTWLMTSSHSNKINRVFASLQRLITNKLVAATQVIEREQKVTKYLLNLPYADLQQQRAARVRATTMQLTNGGCSMSIETS